MKNRKAILGLLLLLIFSFTGCSSNKAEPADTAPVPAVTQQVPASPSEVKTVPEQTQPQPTEKAAGDTAPTAEPKKPEASGKQNIGGANEKVAEQKAAIKLEGTGIKKAVELSLDEMKDIKEAIVEDDFFSLNNYGTKKYFHFKGIAVWQLLKEKAGIKEEAKSVTFSADDGYSVTYTIDEVKREDYIDEQNPEKKYKMIIAWEEEGKEYNPEDGKPFKLVIGQKEPGDINKPNWVQNLSKITVEQ